MHETDTFKECCSYVAALVHAQDHPEANRPNQALPAITISRQAGSRGRSIGQKLQQALRAQSIKDHIPWTFFDEDLVEKVLKDHHLPKEMAKFMPDDSVNEIDSMINEILGRHPSLWTLFEYTVETMVQLCRAGNCILVGRGGNKVAEGLSNVMRVRFVGSEQRRLRQMTQAHKLSLKQAKTYLKQEDRARQRYMKQHFDSDVDDPLEYDLVINTDRYSDETVVQIMLHALTTSPHS